MVRACKELLRRIPQGYPGYCESDPIRIYGRESFLLICQRPKSHFPMSFLEAFLLIPLILFLVASMMAYAYVSGTMRTREAEHRDDTLGDRKP